MKHPSLTCSHTHLPLIKPIKGPDGNDYDKSVFKNVARHKGFRENQFYRNYVLQAYIGLKPTELQQKVQDCFICPITLHIPLTPVLCSDGWTYELEAIRREINTKDKLLSPMTREALQRKAYPAHNIARLIKKYFPEHNLNDIEGTEIDISPPRDRITSDPILRNLIPSLSMGFKIGFGASFIVTYAVIFSNTIRPDAHIMYITALYTFHVQLCFFLLCGHIGLGIEMAIRWLLQLVIRPLLQAAIGQSN